MRAGVRQTVGKGLDMRLVLASRSPRRRRILEALGREFEVAEPETGEVMWPQDPTGMVRENALRKWRWCHVRYPDAAIIAADTTVVLAGTCLGKPRTPSAAAAMLRACAGHTQTVHTGYVLALPGETQPAAAVETSTVHFQLLREDTIMAYIAAVNPMDRAGGYDIDCHGDWIIAGYEGSYTNIMGLPEERVREWMACKLANWR